MFLIKRRRFPKIFFGWWTVIGGGILSLWGWGYYTYGFSALFKPLASELGFGRAVMSVPSSIGRFEGGLEGPVSGWLTDRFGPRWIVIVGILFLGLGLILMNFINSLWAFYIVWGVLLGTGANVALSIPLDVSITNWFVKKRGLALSTKMVLSGISGVLVLPLIAWLISTQGWRMTCLIGGVVTLLVGLPISWFCLKRYRPEYYGLLPDGATVKEEAKDTSLVIDRGVKYAAEVGEVEFTLRQAMKTPTFWLLIAAHMTNGMAHPVITVHSIPFLTDIGMSPIKAASIVSLNVLVSLPMRFVGGLVADRIKKQHLRFILAVAYSVQALCFTLLTLTQTTVMIYVAYIAYGLGQGIAATAYTVLVGRYFGRKSFGSIQGTKMMFLTVSAMVAPIYAGWIYDTTGSYLVAFATVAALLFVATFLISITKPPKPPAEVTDIRKLV